MSGRVCNCGSSDMKSIKAISEQLEIKSRTTTVGGGFFGGKGGVGAARSYGNLSPGIIKKIQWRIPHKTGIFSINTCNGYTKLEDGTKIDSVANRMLLFDASRPHTPSTTTDQTVRVNINFNYF